MYNGYRIKINGIIVDNNIISRGSYSLQKKKRVLAEYYDANGDRHEETSPREKAEISFTIRERTTKEQSGLSGIWEVCENILVEYWNDKTATYETGLFKMESPVFKHRNTLGGTINYDRTTISLREY